MSKYNDELNEMTREKEKGMDTLCVYVHSRERKNIENNVVTPKNPYLTHYVFMSTLKREKH